MVFVTGDTHGRQFQKLNTIRFLEQKKEMTKQDFVIICGDFGLVWDKDSKEEQYWRSWLDSKPWTTLFVDGNHENFDTLYQYPLKEMYGGRVRQISDSIFHLNRGDVFNLEGKTFFTFGGAASHDKEWRVPGISWWPEEMPNGRQMLRGLNNLVQNGRTVDFILTHAAPSSIQRDINPMFSGDSLTEYLEEIKNSIDYSKWFFAHYHTDKQVDAKHQCLYHRVERVV